MTVRWGLLIFAVLLASIARAQTPGPTPVPPVSADAASSSQSSSAGSSRVPATSQKPPYYLVPSGTAIPLVLENAISTRSAHAGDPVYFQTLYPIIVQGRILIPAGSYMSGQVLSSKRPGRIKGRGQLVLKLTQLILPNGYTVSLEGTPSGAETGGGEISGKEGKIKSPGSKADDAAVLIRSTVYGAGIGAAAGGLTGARAGLGVGAAAGLLAVLLTRGPDAELPRGTTMEARLDRPLPLLASRDHFTGPGHAPDLAGPPNREPRRRAIPF